MPINYLKRIQLCEFDANGFRIPPSGALAALIEGFYVFSREAGDDTHLVFGDGFPVLVFLPQPDDCVTVTVQGKTFMVTAAWASAGAIKNVYVRYAYNIDQVFIVRFYPAAFYQLFGLAPAYFRHNPVAPFAPIAKNSHFSVEGFFRHDTVEEKIAFVEAFVQGSLGEVHTPEALHWTMDQIRREKGKSTVKELSHDAGVNYKWLERSFAKNIGLLPKEYIQLQRFMHAYLELVGSQEVDLMRIAVTNGYYDANHFLKDFKTYTGKTPLEYLRFQGQVHRC